MAQTLTIKTNPPDYAPVYNILECCVYDTDGAKRVNTNFSYVFDVVTTLYGTHRFIVKPETVLSYGTQDMSRLLQGFITESIAPYDSTVPFTQGLEPMILEYRVEYYNAWDVAGVFTVDPDSNGALVGKTTYAWCGAFDSHERITQINLGTPYNNWVMSVANGSDTSFLTAYKQSKVQLTDLGWTWLLTSNTAEVDYVEYKTYDSDDNLIQTATANDSSLSLVPGKVKSLATSPQSINNISVLASGAQPIITSSIAYYTVTVFEATPNAISETLTFTLQDNSDCRYQTYRLHFLNELGGFDSYNFTARSQQSSTAKRKSYTRSQTVIASSGITYSHENIGSLDYYVRTGKKIKLKSEFLTDDENTWLRELIDSPNILWETTDSQGATMFYPVKMLTNNWTDKKNTIDGLFQLELDIELSLQSTRDISALSPSSLFTNANIIKIGKRTTLY
jgi:hypothetical protein